MSKKTLQAVTAVLGMVPLLTGALTLMGLDDPLYRNAGVLPLPVLDSNLRFFGGLWLGLGISLFWLIPRIDTETALFRIAWGAIFLGGIGRLLSMAFAGMPPLPFVGFTLLEIVGAPLFIYWQHRVAQATQSQQTRATTQHPQSSLTQPQLSR